MKFPIKVFTVRATLHSGYLDTGTYKLPVIDSDYPKVLAYWEIQDEIRGFRILSYTPIP